MQTYVLDATTCSDPSVSPPGGTFNTAQFPMPVSLTCSTPGAAIYWSLTQMPNSAADGTLHDGTSVPVPAGATLYCRAFAAGLSAGPGLAQTYLPFSDAWSGGTGSPGGYGGAATFLN